MDEIFRHGHYRPQERRRRDLSVLGTLAYPEGPIAL